MNINNNIADAFSNLKSSKLRSFLAILGILIGTGSVVALVSSGELATRAALAQFKSLGTNLLSVSMYQQQSANKPGQSTGAGTAMHKKLSVKDAQNIVTASPYIDIAAPYTNAFATVTFKGHHLSASTIGATQSLATAIKIGVAKGRFISLLDHYSSYCFIGSGLANQLQQYGAANPIGKQIRIGSNIFTIIGVAKNWPQNNFFNQDINHSIIIPIQTSYILSKYTQINNIVFRLKTGAPITTVQASIKQYLAKHAPGNSLFVRSAQQLIAKMQAQQQTFTLLLGVIGGISLLVGGIGVMNIMLVSVVERRREIGIRRAIGAKKRDIQLLFVVESTTLSLFGGVLGVIFGVLASFLIAEFSHWQFTLFIIPPILGFVVSASLGIFFGFYPAYRASQLDPITALRSD